MWARASLGNMVDEFPVGSLYVGSRQDHHTPAATPMEARLTGKPIGPATLVAPMPSITPIKPDTVTEEHAGPLCSVSSFAANNPLMAIAAAAALYFVLRGK